MTTAIPLVVLIEASECLKLALSSAPAGSYMRLLKASTRLDVRLAALLVNQSIEVTQ